MKKITIGIKNESTNYSFRETCFGIVYINKNFYLTKKKEEISLIGGGIEKNETHIETLKREFLEESGLTIKSFQHFITIDCYWKTKNNSHTNSLSHFYIIKIGDKQSKPSEKLCELYITKKEEILNLLPLPYQNKAIELFLKENKKI